MTRDQAEAIFPYSELPKVQVNCPLCGQENASILRTDRYGYAVPYAVCACGMEYLTEQLTREGYDRLYRGGYRQLVQAFNGRAAGIRTTVESAAPLLTFARQTYGPALRGWRVIDVGGSTGVIGQALKPAALTVLDPAPQELPEGGIVGYIEDPIVGDYDLALCIDMVDHLTNPLAALRNLRTVTPRLLLNYVDVRMVFMIQRMRVLKIDHPLYWNSRSIGRALHETGWSGARGTYLATRDNGRPIYRSTLVACERKE